MYFILECVSLFKKVLGFDLCQESICASITRLFRQIIQKNTKKGNKINTSILERRYESNLDLLFLYAIREINICFNNSNLSHIKQWKKSKYNKSILQLQFSYWKLFRLTMNTKKVWHEILLASTNSNATIPTLSVMLAQSGIVLGGVSTCGSAFKHCYLLLAATYVILVMVSPSSTCSSFSVQNLPLI